MSVCITVPSWTLLFLPISISTLSPRNTALNQTLAPSSSLTLPTSTALGATQLCGWVSTRASPRRYFILLSSWLRQPRCLAIRKMASNIDKAFGWVVQADVGVIKQVDQLDDHDRGQTPDLVFTITIARHIPTATLVIDAMRVFARVFSKELQRHAEHSRNFGIVGQVFDVIRNDADIGRDLDAVQGDQRTERADHFHQPRRQADFFFGFAQGSENKVRVFGVASPAGEGDFAAMGREPAGAKGQNQFRFVTAGDRHEYRRLGETLVGFQGAWRVVAYPMQ